MGDRAAISMQGVSLNYRLLHQEEHSLKAAMISRIKLRHRVEYLPALRSVNMDIMPGQSVAVMGPNGSGKSTMLKLIANVFSPSAGTIIINGVVAALLELGAGFAHELTGLENIRLNAALLGQSEEWAEKNRDSIIAFSELGHFIDTPLRHYSSGMYMRLGFAVAIHTDADVFLFDEVIAVGDAGFQAKCRAAIEEKKENGATMMIVSHSPESLAGLCERGVVLNHGAIVFDGALDKAIRQYHIIYGG